MTRSRKSKESWGRRKEIESARSVTWDGGHFHQISRQDIHSNATMAMNIIVILCQLVSTGERSIDTGTPDGAILHSHALVLNSVSMC